MTAGEGVVLLSPGDWVAHPDAEAETERERVGDVQPLEVGEPLREGVPETEGVAQGDGECMPEGVCVEELQPLVLCVALTAGCRLLGLALPTADGPQTEAAERPRTAAHTIPVELLFVRCDEHDAVLRDELWNFVDEQALGDVTRRCLNANGLRVGIVGGHLPPHLADRFVALDAPAGDEFPAASAVTLPRLCR